MGHENWVDDQWLHDTAARGAQAEASWQQRALNAEQALKAAHAESARLPCASRSSARSCVITLSRSATARSRSASRLTSSARGNGSYPATHKDQHISDDDARITAPRVSSLSHQGHRGAGRRCRLVNSSRRKWRYTGDGSIADGSAP